MPEYSSICYKNSFLNQVIVRSDFLQFVPTNMTFSESIEKEILRIFPRRGNQYFYDGIQVTSQVSVDEQP